jgi:DNA-binding NtrC family response regulator
MNLLIIDDNPDQLFSLKIALRTKSYQVTTVGSGLAALRALDASDSKIDIVLTDYAMPEMTGLELLSEIQRRYPSLPVIIMTAYGKKETVIEAIHGGCAGYIEKPFTIEQLIPVLEKAGKTSRREFERIEMTGIILSLLERVNDQLTIIGGNAEIALLNLEEKRLDYVKNQLVRISELAHDIGTTTNTTLTTMQQYGYDRKKV